MIMSSEINNKELQNWIKDASRFAGCVNAKELVELKIFLMRLQQNISDSKAHLKLTGLLEKFPQLGQFLGHLCRCDEVILHTELYELLMTCVLLLSTQNPTNVLEQKATIWARTQIRQTVSYFKQKDPCSSLAHAVGCYPDQYNTKSCSKLTDEICARLQTCPKHTWDHKAGLMLPCRPLPSDALTMLSLRCLRLLKIPGSHHVVEALVACHSGDSVQESLHPAFLEALVESQCCAYLDSPCTVQLSYHCHVALWDRYLPALEAEVMSLMKALGRRQPWLPREEAMKLINTRHLPRACLEHPSIYAVVDNLFQASVMKTQASPDVLRMLDYFNQALLVCADDGTTQNLSSSLCSLYPLQYRSLLNLLILSAQGLSIPSCCLHLNHIDGILKEIVNCSSQTSKDFYQLWLVLIRWPSWYYKAVEMTLVAGWSQRPPGTVLMCWFNYPLQSEKHTGFQETIASLGGTLRKFVNQSNPQVKDLKSALSLANHNPDCSQVTSNLFQPMCLLLVVYSEDWLTNLHYIVHLTLQVDGEVASPVHQLRFILDAVELFHHLHGNHQPPPTGQALLKYLQDLKKDSLNDILAGGDGGQSRLRQDKTDMLTCCGYMERYLQTMLRSR